VRDRDWILLRIQNRFDFNPPWIVGGTHELLASDVGVDSAHSLTIQEEIMCDLTLADKFFWLTFASVVLFILSLGNRKRY
jgi:hypothetical protein